MWCSQRVWRVQEGCKSEAHSLQKHTQPVLHSTQMVFDGTCGFSITVRNIPELRSQCNMIFSNKVPINVNDMFFVRILKYSRCLWNKSIQEKVHIIWNHSITHSLNTEALIFLRNFTANNRKSMYVSCKGICSKYVYKSFLFSMGENLCAKAASQKFPQFSYSTQWLSIP